MEVSDNPRVVLFHDWLTGMRGGEKCLEVLCKRWQEAPVYTLLHKRGAATHVIENRSIHESFLRLFPGAHRYYRYLLPLMPLAARWKLPNCDLVVSLSHCVAKAALPPAGTPHLCYCFTPMRYAWHLRDAYFGKPRGSGLTAHLRDRFLSRLREWDKQTAQRVTHFVAISRTVQRRIAECYGRESRVIYPPVDTDFYTPAAVPRENFYLVVSAFAPYKRIDLAIEACQKLRRPLVIIGSGQEERRLRRTANANVRFLGWQSNEVIRDHMCRCRALLFPGEEDFGIVPVEAQACGTPVIAYRRGGAAETVVTDPQPTGILFEDQSALCVANAILDFERARDHFSPAIARRNALRFRSERFADEFFALAASIVSANRSQADGHDKSQRAVAAKKDRQRGPQRAPAADENRQPITIA